MRTTKSLFAAASMMLLAACSATRSSYMTPAPSAPIAAGWVYGDASTRAADVSSDPWWTNFGDPGLDALVAYVLARNNDLAAATLRVRRAQLLAGLADTDKLPRFGASASAGLSGDLDGDNLEDRYSVGASVSYEVDLWDRLGALADAADWEAVATAEDREATALALIGTTANLYFQLGYTNERIDYAELSLDYARRTQALIGARYAAGAESGLAVQEARQSVQSQEAALATLTQQRVETLNAIGVLLGSGSGAAPQPEPQTLLAGELPAIDAGLPAALLARRPDLRAAEARLRSTLAGADATRASFYPSLSLTGSAGGASTSLLQVLSNPTGAISAALSLPFLNGAEMRLTNAAARTGFQEAEVNFRQTLAVALADVENALSARTQADLQGARLRESLDAARIAERLNEVRYRSGAASLREWLDSQERRRSAEIAVLDNHLQQLNGHVALYQVLGGDTGTSSGGGLAVRPTAAALGS